jgi:NAD(P)-dependent dehydrogenase (short-subunit alcohol dehydrogenase family)|tara:strand:+ start:224 stop:922 length:699 start_codon:yes stop_codon:yes gene_type:complete
MPRPICLITGVGPGTGTAIARRFSEKYDVAMLARNRDRLANLRNENKNLYPYQCDVSDPEALIKTIDSVGKELGNPSVVIHNAVGGAFGNFLEVDLSVLEHNFQVNTMALMQLGQLIAPNMIENGNGAIICTGNTSAYRGKAGFSGFAPTKAAQRILAESMARYLGPKGIHVAYVAIDAVIDLEWTRKRNPDAPDDYFCKPDDIAGEVWHLAHQPKSAWSFDTQIRPFGENW